MVFYIWLLEQNVLGSGLQGSIYRLEGKATISHQGHAVHTSLSSDTQDADVPSISKTSVGFLCTKITRYNKSE